MVDIRAPNQPAVLVRLAYVACSGAASGAGTLTLAARDRLEAHSDSEISRKAEKEWGIAGLTAYAPREGGSPAPRTTRWSVSSENPLVILIE